MSSTVINRVLAAIFALVIFMSTSIAAPTASNEQVAVVGSLYKAFAWQALSSDDGIFGKSLAQQDNAALRRYFDRELAALLVADQRCVMQSGEVCNLDFDPIFASQDPGAIDLSIRSTAPGIVSVEFTYPGNREKIRLEYRLVKDDGQWRISDISYPGNTNMSLKRMLAAGAQSGKPVRP